MAIARLLGAVLVVLLWTASVVFAVDCTTPGFCTPTAWGDCRSPGPGEIDQRTWTEVKNSGNSWCCNTANGSVVACEEPLQFGVVKCWSSYYQSNFNGWDSATCPAMGTEATGIRCKLNCVTTTTWTKKAGVNNGCAGDDENGYTCLNYTDTSLYDVVYTYSCLIEFGPCP